MDGKSPLGHTHPISEIIGLDARLTELEDFDNTTFVTEAVGSTPASITINGVSVSLDGSGGMGGFDPRFPSSGNNLGNYWKITGVNGTSAGVSPTVVKNDLGLSNVDNTSDLDKPISNLTQIQLDLKAGLDDVFSGDYNDLTNRPTTITQQQSDDIANNNLKRSYPLADENKLATIEPGADVTDTANVYVALGANGSTGRINYFLNERGQWVQILGDGSSFDTTANYDVIGDWDFDGSVDLSDANVTLPPGLLPVNPFNGFTETNSPSSTNNFPTWAASGQLTWVPNPSGVTSPFDSFNITGSPSTTNNSIRWVGPGNELAWSQSVVANPGGTGDPLNTIEIDGVVYALPGSQVQLLTDISSVSYALSGSQQLVAITLTGAPNTVVDLTIQNATPANFIQDSDLSATQVALNSAGTGGTLLSLPALGLGSRTFQIQGTAVGVGQNPLLSPVYTQTADSFITSVALGTVTFNRFGTTELITITGTPNLPYALDLVSVTPTGWITSGALSTQSGTLSSSGVGTATVTIPIGDDDTFSRTFAIRATGTNGNEHATATSTTITQSHTQTTAAGNLSVASDFNYSSPNLIFSANVLTGDGPFTLVLNQHATDATDNPIETINLTSLGLATFTALNVSSIPDGGVQYYIHVSDSDGDIVVTPELVTIANQAPMGTISLTTGSVNPVDSEVLQFTSAFTDVEADPLTYQWQHIAATGVDINETFTIDSDIGGQLDNLPNVQAYNQLGGGGSVFVIAVNSTAQHIITFTATDGTEYTFTGVGGVADNHGSTGGFNEFVVISDGVARAAVQATADGTLDNGAFYWNADSITITEDGVDWEDITGETNPTYSLTASTTTVNDINSARNTLGFSVSDEQADALATIAVFSNNNLNVIFWGADTNAATDVNGNVNTDSTVAIWANNADHSTTAPLLIGNATMATPEEGAFAWSLSGVLDYRDGSISGPASLDLIAAADDTTGTAGTQIVYRYEAANIEIWTGDQYTTATVPTITTVDQAGGYRCVVTATTGNTTPVISNTIEIER